METWRTYSLLLALSTIGWTIAAIASPSIPAIATAPAVGVSAGMAWGARMAFKVPPFLSAMVVGGGFVAMVAAVGSPVEFFGRSLGVCAYFVAALTAEEYYDGR